jgi:class 3 adenylate cyclase
MDAGARKVVTIVFADLVGSTALHERLDAESARRVMEHYYEALRAAVDAHGGTVVKLLGDGVMAAFGLKQVAEDDALRAVRAAAAMQDAFRALVLTDGAALGAAGLRVAVNTGEVVVSGARDDVIGDPVNVAARLQEQGGDGDVVLGEATRRLIATRVTLAPLGSVTLKGRAEAVAAYRLVSLEPPAGAAATPFVGRESELERLEAAYDAAVATPATRLAVLLGSPGLGKSRLIDELGRRHADGATILAAHCDAAGGTTFAPLAQVLRGFLGLDDGAGSDAVRTAVAAALSTGEESERTRIAVGIAGLLGGAATSPEETFFVVRRFLAGLAASKPVVLVIDDLHWAEPLLLDLVEHLVQWGSGVPLFVLVGAPPARRDLRHPRHAPRHAAADAIARRAPPLRPARDSRGLLGAGAARDVGERRGRRPLRCRRLRDRGRRGLWHRRAWPAPTRRDFRR